MAEEEKRFRDYQPEGVLKDSIFDFIPDPYQMHEYLAAKRGIPSLDELDEFKYGTDPSPELKTFIDSMELQREKIREAIREKGSPLTDEETAVIKEKYPSYSFLTEEDPSAWRTMPARPPRLAYGGSPEQEFINDRIAELMMEEPLGNEMRASSPDVFQKQERAIESFLSGIGQFADEKNIPFLRALADPQYAGNVAESTSFGAEMTPGLGDIQAIREGSRMMGDDQPLMGAALMAGSIFTNMPANKLKKLLEKAQRKLEDDIPQRIYDAKNYMRQRSKADQFQGQRMMKEANDEKRKLKKEIAEIEDALVNPELPFGAKTPLRDQVKSFDELIGSFDDFKKESSSWIPKKEKLASVTDLNRARVEKVLKEQQSLFNVPPKTPKQVRKENLRGIVNANAETRRLYQEIIDSPSRINTRDHQKVAKETSEQFREIQKGIKDADLEERNEIIRLLARLKNKKPK